MNVKNRILIVDEPGKIQFLTTKLPSEEYDILCSYTGEDALERAARDMPDVILVNANMPGMDGYAVTQHIKHDPKLRDIPVILITKQHETEDKVKGLASGADEFLNRPIDAAELQARVRSLTALKRYEEQLQSRIHSEKVFSTPSPPQHLAKRTLLIVEDDDVAAKLILNCLKDHSYHLEFAPDGASAIQRAEKGGIDLILLDILLPGIDGFEVCRRVKAISHCQQTQIVMITCLQDMESKIRGIELGVDDFLIKPINKEILTARVRALLKKKAYIDQLTFEYERALHSAITDNLTSLYNQGYFKQFLKLEIERSVRQRHPLALLLFDIDDFKLYNDTLGHLAGDQVLRELGQIIHNTIRQIDMAARYGGEEFVIVLPYTDSKGAVVVAERLKEAVEGHTFSYKPELPSRSLTISTGVAGFQQGTPVSVDHLIEQADRALYKAKRAGKNRVCAFDYGEKNIKRET
jgi:two-component system cell cycle response regulator